jgi:MurNAc alpha-1-phosphate uridylyltransferase
MLPIAILAGGLATRIRPISDSIPKSLIMINRKPFLEWQLQLLEKNKCELVVICVSYKSEMIKDFIQNRAKSNLNIHLAFDGTKQLGTGGALVKAKELLGPAFMVLYGDSYLPINYENISNHFVESNKLGLLTIMKNEINAEPSNVVFKNGYVEKYDKKFSSEDMHYIDFGLSAFKLDAFDGYPINETLDLSLIHSSLATRRELLGYKVHQRYFEVGSFQGIQDFQKFSRGL